MKNILFRGFVSVMFISSALFSWHPPPPAASAFEKMLINYFLDALGCDEEEKARVDPDNPKGTPENTIYEQTAQGDEEYKKRNYGGAITHYEQAEKAITAPSGSQLERDHLTDLSVKLAKAHEMLGWKIPFVTTKSEREHLDKAGFYWERAAECTTDVHNEKDDKLKYYIQASLRYHEAGNDRACMMVDKAEPLAYGSLSKYAQEQRKQIAEMRKELKCY